MPDTPSITIVKRFPYRGDTMEEFSNKYHFSGDVPGDDAAWKTLADAIIAAERPMLPASVSFVRAYGHEAGNEFAVATIDYTAPPLTPVAGTLAVSGVAKAPGDAAFWVRWRTAHKNSRGKWIYLRKYFHGVLIGTTDGDIVATQQKAAAEAYAPKMTDGSLPGGVKICGPQGAVAGPAAVSTYTTTRTLKRRGKRPS